MPGRYSLDGPAKQVLDVAGPTYRYGFNGKENDNEVKGVEGAQQDYGMRIYDPGIAKFLSVDPITAQYPELTPYQFASNSPLQGIDLDGLELLKINSSAYRMRYLGTYPKLTMTTTETDGTMPTQFKGDKKDQVFSQKEVVAIGEILMHDNGIRKQEKTK